MNFNNKMFEQEVREAIAKQREQDGGDAPGREPTEEDLKLITGILIAPMFVNSYPIPWVNDSSAYKMEHPNLFITWDMWDEGDMARFGHIKALYAFFGEEGEMPFIPLELFPNLRNIYAQRIRVSDWACLEDMQDLCMLYVSQCGGDGNKLLKHAGNLRKTQDARRKAKKNSGEEPLKIVLMSSLDHIGIIDMNITDISTVDWKTDWSDVNFSHNNIEDISALEDSNIFSLILRHNLISDISALRRNRCHLLYLRHNIINDITPLIEGIKQGTYDASHLYLNYNPIPRQQLEFFTDADIAAALVRTDFLEYDAAGCKVRQDFIMEQYKKK